MMSKSFKLGEGGRNVSRARTKKKLSPQHHQLYQQYKHMSGPVPFKSAWNARWNWTILSTRVKDHWGQNQIQHHTFYSHITYKHSPPSLAA